MPISVLIPHDQRRYAILKKVILVLLAILILASAAILWASGEGEIIYYEDSFDDYDADLNISATPMVDRFILNANSIGDSSIKTVEDKDGNLYVCSRVFTEGFNKKVLNCGYTYEMDILEMQGGHQAAMFIRGVANSVAFYEDDGDDSQYENSLGRVGIYLYASENSLEVNIKSYNKSSTSRVSNNCHTFELPEGVHFNQGEYVNLKVVDDGSLITIYVAGDEVCHITLEEPTETYRNASVRDKCFNKVAMFSPDGTEIMTVTRTYVGAENFYVGWATRVSVITFDNFKLTTATDQFAEATVAETTVAETTEPEATTAETTEAVTTEEIKTVVDTEDDNKAVPAKETLDEAPVSHNDLDYSRFTKDEKTYIYDFTDTDIQAYSRDEILATASLRTNMIFSDGKLSCVKNKTFSFGSSVFLGDNYGLYGGKLGFSLLESSGKLSVGVRLSKRAADNTKRGLWFTFEDGVLTVSEPESKFSVIVPFASSDMERVFTLKDTPENITLYCDGNLIVRVTYDIYRRSFTVMSPDNITLGTSVTTNVNPAGFFTLFADGLDGYIDDVSFTHMYLTENQYTSLNERPIDYSTWTATDDRGRTTPTGQQTGEVRADKQIGIFYFISMTEDPAEIPKDNTAMYLERGVAGLKAYLEDVNSPSGTYYWSEPYFGYYRDTDTWVQRKHAYMLEAAGVDFIFIDLTNGATYENALVQLFDTWLEIRHEGGMTPDICIIAGSSMGAVVGNLRGNIYSDENWEKYSELFYEYEGKPLILGDIDRAGAANMEFLKKFTVRGCWAWQDQNNYWSWLQEYKINPNGSVDLINGGLGRDADGNFEALALCIGHHPTTSKGRSYANNVFPEVPQDFGFSLDSGSGYGFAEQFKAIQYFDPKIVLITGWNEWAAGFNHDDTKKFAGTTVNGFSFVDQFNTEYSRDAEPMKLRDGEKSVGFGDNYYYQLCSIIRTYKGIDKVTPASGQASIDITDISAWNNIGPEYRDTTGDTTMRSTDGYFGGYTYVNNSGRNDFDYAKVSQDEKYLYFLIKCTSDIEIDDGQSWMNLYINIDGNSKTGWEGYDFAVNRSRDGHYADIESLADGWSGKFTGKALYNIDGKYMVIRVIKAALGIEGELTSFNFKWADNSTEDGNIMEFMDLGDTAPNDCFAYIYNGIQAKTTTPLKYTLSFADGTTKTVVSDPVRAGITTHPDTTETTEVTSDETESTSDVPESTSPTDNETTAETADNTTAASPESTSAGDVTAENTEDTGCGSAVISLTTLIPAILVATVPALIRKKREE